MAFFNPILKIKRPGKGRPRNIDLTDDQKAELAAIYLETNANKKSGSMTLAWSFFIERHPEIGFDPAKYSSKHTLPAVALEVMKNAKPLVGFHRGGERKLRDASYQPGLLRRNPDGSMLRAGQRASWDDATINFGVVIPWPWRGSGDKCADRYGVRLGRFQLLVCHDDATSFIPTYSYVVRFEQSYRAVDIASAMIRTSRDIGIFDAYVLEGGNWKSHRVQAVLDALNITHIDAKGRPQCKLVENFFNRLWTLLSSTPGQVGRFQAENKETSEIYVACRAGRKDPRKYFPSLKEAIDTIGWAINRLNNTRIESKEYGKWTPSEQWEKDLETQPMRSMNIQLGHLEYPIIETRTVVKGALKMTTTGNLGVPQRFSFTAPWLFKHEGEKLALHFDPLGEWPITGIVTKSGQTKPLGEVICNNPVFMGGTDENTSKQIRQIMRTEYRAMTAKGVAGSQTDFRGINGTATIHQGSCTPQENITEPIPETLTETPEPQTIERVIRRDSLPTQPETVTPDRTSFDALSRRKNALKTQTAATTLKW